MEISRFTYSFRQLEHHLSVKGKKKEKHDGVLSMFRRHFVYYCLLSWKFDTEIRILFHFHWITQSNGKARRDEGTHVLTIHHVLETCKNPPLKHSGRECRSSNGPMSLYPGPTARQGCCYINRCPVLSYIYIFIFFDFTTIVYIYIIYSKDYIQRITVTNQNFKFKK